MEYKVVKNLVKKIIKTDCYLLDKVRTVSEEVNFNEEN